jgi:enolase-phosphatase E1
MIRAILCDIEGTTTAISFVHEILFPYARRNLARFVEENQDDERVSQILSSTRKEAGVEEGTPAVPILLQWIDEDRKATPLKSLQGMIWEAGYHNGSLKGHLYEDAVSGLKRWGKAGISLYIYSSGSVYAQKLLFGYSEYGDLQPLFSGNFDTKIGHKKETESYLRIQREIGLPANEILFLSDVGAELDAAADAGMKTIQLIREDSIKPAKGHRQEASFDVILP